jgi:ubiquinone/menaquinone biosynthesis C-methylase UbiE
MMAINKINELYKTKKGDEFALEELLPLAKKYITEKKPKILEIGCGYGRNLFALAHIAGSQVVGCDISLQELQKAKEKIEAYEITNVTTTPQTELNKLPFIDNSFDFVVIWQVLEHVLSKEDKKILLNEATRVTKNGGHILIETPNFLFPFDYHDNNLPLIHWIVPNKWRRIITTKIRKEDFPPSQYTNIYQIRNFFKQSPHIKSFVQITKIYFEERYGDIFRHLGGTHKKLKLVFFLLYAPVYYILRFLHLPGDTFTPSVRVIFRITK